MKKKILILFVLCISIFVIGCKKDNKNIINNLKKNIEDVSAYNLKGSLELINNEDIYTYDVDVSYKEPNYFRVSLKNINNNHIQILLKNNDGVYVLTPALNKSFKFQSDWPYNNSQIYLLQTILKDIEKDSNARVEETNDGYIIISKVNYSNNDELVSQKVYLNKNYEIKKVEVLNNNGNVLMNFKIQNINTKPNFGSDYFNLDNSINTSNVNDDAKQVSKIDTIIYPMYMPTQTYLASQNKVNLQNGERVILTFDGESPFMLVQETANVEKELTTIPVTGSPEIVGDAIGILSDNSISWSSNGIDYYVTSNSLTEKELLTVANSINVLPVSK